MATFNSFPFDGKKITENPASDAITGSEVLVLVQGGVSKRITISELREYLSNVTVPNANEGRLGIVKLSKAPANATHPIAVGANDERVAATGVTAGTYGSTKLLSIEVDTYGKIKSISESSLSVNASDVSGLSTAIQTVGDAKYIQQDLSLLISVWDPEREYEADELSVRLDKLYRSKVNENIGNDPVTSGAEWQIIGGVSGASSFAELEGSPDDNPALSSRLNDIEAKADVAQEDVDALEIIVATKLTGTMATDPETQISSAVTEDSKFVSRLKLFNWWVWAKTQIQTFTETVTFTKAPIVSELNTNSFVTTDGTKKLKTEYTPTGPYITNTTTQTRLALKTNWNAAGAYVGPALDETQGSWWKDAQYLYTMYDTTTPMRESINGGSEHLVSNSAAPSIAAGAAAGTSPTIAIAGNDISCRVTLTTGTSTTTGVLFTVTFNQAFGSAPRVTPAARNAIAAEHFTYYHVSNETTTTFVISARVALTASTQYIFNFLIAQ